MRQALHILKKDLRRHWPEIAISLVLLGLYVRLTLRGPDNQTNGYFPWYRISAESIPYLMVLLWVFLTIRVVQGETLVGDRQWWVTKPYEWWQLLLAKELFLILCVSVPLFLVQLFLLIHAGFPIFPNIPGVLNLQLGLAIFLFLPSLTLGSLSKNLAQALLGVLAVLLIFSVFMWLSDKVPSSSMTSAADIAGEATGLVLFASIVGAAGWQYARRKTWASRGLLLAGVAAIALIGALTPYARFVESKYPLIESSEAPVKFVPLVAVSPAKKRNDLTNLLPEVRLKIPLESYGIASGRVALLQGIKVVIETSRGIRLDPGWHAQWTAFWAEDERKNITYELKQDDYQRLKTETVQLHVELALQEYQETQVRDVILPEGKFSDQELGICQLTDKSRSQIECRRPFRYPGLMASFDPAGSTCHAEEDENQIPENKVSHVWYAPPSEDSPEPGLNPVVEYPIMFGPQTWQQFSPTGSTKPKRKTVFLCPGAKVRIAKPEAKRYARVKFDMPAVRLQDLAAGRFDFD